jgi:hypothetical protein
MFFSRQFVETLLRYPAGEGYVIPVTVIDRQLERHPTTAFL